MGRLDIQARPYTWPEHSLAVYMLMPMRQTAAHTRITYTGVALESIAKKIQDGASFVVSCCNPGCQRGCPQSDARWRGSIAHDLRHSACLL